MSKDDKIQASLVVVRTERGMVLFLQRHPKDTRPYRWAMPGGKQKKNETVHDCAKRELKEETGIDALPTEIGTVECKKTGKYVFTVFELLIHKHAGDIPVSLNNEHIGYGWWPPSSPPYGNYVPSKVLNFIRNGIWHAD